MSASLLQTLGLGELVAHSEAEYLAIATALAASPERLGEIRAALRPRLLASVICQGSTFTAALESILQDIHGRA